MWKKTHHRCELCHGSDPASTNMEGWVTCFSCGQRYHEDMVVPYNNVTTTEEVTTMEVGLGKHKMVRSITAETCKRYGIRHRGDDIVFEYTGKANGVVAQKIRKDGEKDNTYTEGDWQAAELFGQHLFNKGGRFLTITEGEYDAASAYQMNGNNPVVSIKNGARIENAVKDCKAAYDFIDSFDTVVIAFDGDEQGQKAAQEVAALFAGKSRIMKHHPDYQDANEYLEHG